MASGNGARRPRTRANDGIESIVRQALQQFVAVSNTEPEQVSGVRSTDEGWSILVDVVDVERVPSTTSVLSTYRVDVDADGRLLGYERIRRYMRAATDTQ